MIARHDLEILHRAAGPRQCAGDSVRRDRPRRPHPFAGRAISRDRAADRAGDDALSRRQRPYRHRHRRAADRAAGERRRRHALHAVLCGLRRDLHADRHVPDRHRSQLRAGAGAEPRLERALVAAAGGAGAGRRRAEEVDRDPADRQPHVAGLAIQQPLSEQLRDHQAQGRDCAAAGCRQCRGVRRRPVFDARLARSREAAGTRAHRPGRHPGAAAAKRAGHRRPDRRAAGARQPGRSSTRSTSRAGSPIRASSPTSSSRPALRRDHAGARRRPGRARRADLFGRSSGSTASRRPAWRSSSLRAPTRCRSETR